MGVFAGSTVWMANGRQKPVEELEVGDEVKDILGETRVVDGIRNMQYSKTGVSYVINGKYLITSQHMFYSADRKLYSIWSHNFAMFDQTEIKNMFTFITEKNKLKQKWVWYSEETSSITTRMYQEDPRWQDVYLNTMNGPEKVELIEQIDMSNEDTMYSHSVTGSGTYYVGGLCVAARTNETWDYVNMKPIDGVVTIINNNPDGRIRNYQRVIDINHDDNEHSCWCPEDQHWKNHWRFK
jgi:hypothetical protein